MRGEKKMPRFNATIWKINKRTRKQIASMEFSAPKMEDARELMLSWMLPNRVIMITEIPPPERPTVNRIERDGVV